MNTPYIIDALRTPIGSFGGSLSTIRPDDLAAIVIKELIKKNPNIPPAEISDVILGCANQAGEDNRNVARMSSLLAGLPFSVPGETVNRLCASGMSAVINAARAIQVGDGDMYIAGGVESMTRAPFVMAKSSSAFSRTVEMYDTSIGWRFINLEMKKLYGVDSMGETAENVAQQFSITREDQDIFAFHSQQKATAAQKNGRFVEEIFPISIPSKKGESIIFSHDEFVKTNTTIEKLSQLKPAFKKDGTVTAGNSSGINDGAAAILLASEDAMKKYQVKPRAKIIASAVVGVEPRIMGIGPVQAIKKVLQKANLKLQDIDVIELNEAFAAQSLACIRELELKDDDVRINPNGGAIALGHPLGMSGARLIMTAMIELEKQQKRFALCTMCIGVGQGMALVIERVEK